MTAVAGGYIQERETTTIEIALVGDAILGRQLLPDALTWHCASSLQTNDTGREERKFHCGLHKAIQGTRRLAARLDERRHQCALLDLSQTIPHGGFAYLSRTARPTKDEDRGSAPANSAPHDNALRRQCTIELLHSKSGPDRPASAPWPAESGKRVQVFTPHPGRIIALYASVGDDVKKGQTLFTIGRPRSPAGRVHSDRGRGRAAIDHPQSGAASRAL